MKPARAILLNGLYGRRFRARYGRAKMIGMRQRSAVRDEYTVPASRALRGDRTARTASGPPERVAVVISEFLDVAERGNPKSTDVAGPDGKRRHFAGLAEPATDPRHRRGEVAKPPTTPPRCERKLLKDGGTGTWVDTETGAERRYSKGKGQFPLKKSG